MTTTDDVATRPPSILMIDGHEYALYQAFLDRIVITDVKLLWLNTVHTWLIALYAVLTAIDATHPDSNQWFFFGRLAVAACWAAMPVFMNNRAVLITPLLASPGIAPTGPQRSRRPPVRGGRFLRATASSNP